MNILWLLMRVQVIDAFRAQWSPEPNGKTQKAWGRTLIVAISVLYLLGVYIFMAYGLYQAGVTIGEPVIGLRFSMLTAGMMTFLMGLFYVTGRLYNCRDSLLLVSLPVSGDVVFLSKLVRVYLDELGLTTCLILPSVILYGVGQGVTLLYWPGALLLLLLAPVLPLTLACIICIGFTYVSGFLKRKELFQILFSLVLIGGVLLFQFFVIRNGDTGDVMTQAAVLIQEKSKLLYKIWPPSGWMTTALTGEAKDAALAWGVIGLSSATALCITVILSRKIFLQGMLSATETGKRGKIAKIRNKETSALKAVYLKEWRLLLRSPTYAMNGLSGALLAPVFTMLPFVAYDGGDLLEKISDAGTSGLSLTAPLAGVMLMSCWVNPVATTAVSREGKMRLFIKSLPLDMRTLLRGKLWMSLSVCWIGAVIVGMLVLALNKVSFSIVLSALFLAFCSAWPANVLGLLIDMRRPRFQWNSEAEAIKQNTNSLIGMGLVPVLFLPQIATAVILSYNPWLQIGAIFLLSVIEGLLLTNLMCRTAKAAAERW
ncbi:MAG: putative ABC transporter permease subunit [Christensenellales bacterium]|jgi:ABC-2 type transport system permease protein